MMSEERKAVHELTDDELRREIAEALGWAEIHTIGNGQDEDTVGKMPQPHPFYQWAPVPNWPGNIGAAFELVCDVLDRLSAHERNNGVSLPWEMSLTIAGVHFIRQDSRYQEQGAFHFVEGRDARALSELAAMALRGMLTGKQRNG